jgi:hypothetical protein
MVSYCFKKREDKKLRRDAIEGELKNPHLPAANAGQF